MVERGKFDEATEYHWRTAVAFVKTNTRAASDARNSVIAHYVCRAPNHDKLKEFYIEASGFDGRGQKTEAPEEDHRYWTVVLAAAIATRVDEGERQKVCAYWGAKMGDRFVENDALRKQWSDVLSAKDSKIAAKAIRDVIEYIEVSHLRGGPEAHSTVQDNYYGWKALQARAGKVLLKIHKPEAAPIPTFDPLDLE